MINSVVIRPGRASAVPVAGPWALLPVVLLTSGSTAHQGRRRVLSLSVLVYVHADLIGPRFLIARGIRTCPPVRAVNVVKLLVFWSQHTHARPHLLPHPER
jgi:hypothetical protein